MFIVSFAVGRDRPDFFGYGTAPIVIYVRTSKQAACQQKSQRNFQGFLKIISEMVKTKFLRIFIRFATLLVVSKEK